MQIGDNLHEMSKPIFREKIRKLFQYVVSWNFPRMRSLNIMPQIYE